MSGSPLTRLWCAPADLRRSGLDPGGVHAGDTAQPSGMGHVRLRLLLHRDLHLGGGVRLRRPSKQRPLGCRSKSPSLLYKANDCFPSRLPRVFIGS